MGEKMLFAFQEESIWEVKNNEKVPRCQLFGGEDIGRWVWCRTWEQENTWLNFLRWDTCCIIRCLRVICKREQKSKLIGDYIKGPKYQAGLIMAFTVEWVGLNRISLGGCHGHSHAFRKVSLAGGCTLAWRRDKSQREGIKRDHHHPSPHQKKKRNSKFV